MNNWPWWYLLVVWGIALVAGVALWQRFTRPSGVPAAAAGTSPGRRVVPVWLAFALLVLLVIALWVTLHWGASHPGSA